MGVVARLLLPVPRADLPHRPPGARAASRRRIRKARACLLRAAACNPRLHVLLTGATGSSWRKVLVQPQATVGSSSRAVVRPETVRRPENERGREGLAAEQRGALLLKRLHISGAQARKFRFVLRRHRAAGPGSRPGGAARDVLDHVIHARPACRSTTPTRRPTAPTSWAAATPGFSAPHPAAPALASSTHRDRDLLHPRPQESSIAAGRGARSRATSTTTSTS